VQEDSLVFCVPVSDDTYRRAARLAGIEDVNLAPVDDPEFSGMRADVDALLIHALDRGLKAMEVQEPVAT
jgi:hypothetical protein